MKSLLFVLIALFSFSVSGLTEEDKLNEETERARLALGKIPSTETVRKFEKQVVDALDSEEEWTDVRECYVMGQYVGSLVAFSNTLKTHPTYAELAQPISNQADILARHCTGDKVGTEEAIRKDLENTDLYIKRAEGLIAADQLKRKEILAESEENKRDNLVELGRHWDKQLDIAGDKIEKAFKEAGKDIEKGINHAGQELKKFFKKNKIKF